LTDFDKIWHSYASWPPGHICQSKLLILKIQDVAISWLLPIATWRHSVLTICHTGLSFVAGISVYTS